MSSAHPDADLFPSATSLAGNLVKRHEKEEPLKLYAGWFCRQNLLSVAFRAVLIVIQVRSSNEFGSV